LETQPATIELTGRELYFLSALVGGKSLYGIDDPFFGALTEDIQRAMDAALASLSARGYLATLADGTLRLDEAVGLIAAVVAFPSAVVTATRSTGDAPAQRTYFLRHPVAIELAGASGVVGDGGADEHPGAATYRLTVLPGVSAAARAVCDLWQIEGATSAAGPAVSVPEHVLQRAQQVVSRIDSEAFQNGTGAQVQAHVAALLAQAGVPQPAAQTLATTLVTARHNGAVVVMRPDRTEWQVGGFAVLGGANGLWRIATAERGGAAWLDLRPAAAAGLVPEVEALLAAAAPADAGAPPIPAATVARPANAGQPAANGRAARV
jgi:hypothetical protein